MLIECRLCRIILCLIGMLTVQRFKRLPFRNNLRGGDVSIIIPTLRNFHKSLSPCA